MVIHVGIIGVGGMGELYIRNFTKSSRARVEAIADIDETRLKYIAEKYHIHKAYLDWHKVVEDPTLDAIAVCTPPRFHHDQVIQALENGKHVLCEKPPALNSKQAFEMEITSKKAGRVLMYGYQYRFSKQANYLRKFIMEGRMGKIYKTRVFYLRREGAPHGWFRIMKLAGGGPLIDCAIHFIDLAWWIIGRPKPIKAFGMTYDLLGKFEVEDNAVALVIFDNKCTMIIEASWLQNWYDEHSISFYGVKAGARLFPLEICFKDNSAWISYKPEIKEVNLQEAKILHFLDAIERDMTPIPNASDGTTIMKIIDAIYDSAKNGKAVSIN